MTTTNPPSNKNLPAELPFDDSMEGRNDAIKWSDLQASSTTLPDLETAGRMLIKERLGYLPSLNVTLAIEPNIRALLMAYQKGETTFDIMLEQADRYIKLARNEDIRRNTTLEYDHSTYELYSSFLSLFAHKAKERIAKFLGYAPPVEYSAEAEMFIRKILADDTIYLDEKITTYDIKAVTLITYRTALYEHGKATADIIPLIGSNLSSLSV
ncbi:hypothetical protein [Mucilaginibacter polytrichastri]|nr:hypothetical protein [Mucilaginibacter polytrichastri]SFT08804.1 hypothetical protein SAMN04487890_11061 [Mucilaginibacter polytrichastri]